MWQFSARPSTCAVRVQGVLPRARVGGRLPLPLWASLASSNQRDNMSDILCIRDTFGLCSPAASRGRFTGLQLLFLFIFLNYKYQPWSRYNGARQWKVNVLCVLCVNIDLKWRQVRSLSQASLCELLPWDYSSQLCCFSRESTELKTGEGRRERWPPRPNTYWLTDGDFCVVIWTVKGTADTFVCAGSFILFWWRSNIGFGPLILIQEEEKCVRTEKAH